MYGCIRENFEVMHLSWVIPECKNKRAYPIHGRLHDSIFKHFWSRKKFWKNKWDHFSFKQQNMHTTHVFDTMHHLYVMHRHTLKNCNKYLFFVHCLCTSPYRPRLIVTAYWFSALFSLKHNCFCIEENNKRIVYKKVT